MDGLVMAQFRRSPQVDVVYKRVHLDGPDTVKIITVGKNKPGTAYLAEEQSSKMDKELNILAGVIARAHTNSPTNDAVLTANGYVYKDLLKDALVNIETDHWHGKLQAMLEKGAYVYKAVRKDVTVGAIILTHLIEAPRTVDSPKMPPAGELPFPDPSNLEAVKAYAISDKNAKEFIRQMRGHIENHLGSRDTDGLWELCGLGIEERFQNQNIGRSLVEHALSQVPSGRRVIIQAETGSRAMYKHIGFRDAMSESHTAATIIVKPEWENGPDFLVFPMMIFQKEESEESRNA